MMTKYTSGTPIDTEAVVRRFDALPVADFPFAHRFDGDKFIFSFAMEDGDIVYGLGESPRGINKRGWVYESYCSDDPFHTETKQSLYAAQKPSGCLSTFRRVSAGIWATRGRTRLRSPSTAPISIFTL